MGCRATLNKPLKLLPGSPDWVKYGSLKTSAGTTEPACPDCSLSAGSSPQGSVLYSGIICRRPAVSLVFPAIGKLKSAEQLSQSSIQESTGSHLGATALRVNCPKMNVSIGGVDFRCLLAFSCMLKAVGGTVWAPGHWRQWSWGPFAYPSAFFNLTI